MKHSQIYIADLNPRKGTEPGKKRPVLIWQDQALLDVGHPSTVVIPLTTNLIDDAEPMRIRIRTHASLKQDSDLLIDQIRSIDNARLTSGPIGQLTRAQIRKVSESLIAVLGMD